VTLAIEQESSREISDSPFSPLLPDSCRCTASGELIAPLISNSIWGKSLMSWYTRAYCRGGMSLFAMVDTPKKGWKEEGKPVLDKRCDSRYISGNLR
jgi:hypothetical protein